MAAISSGGDNSIFQSKLVRYYGMFTLGFLALTVIILLLEVSVGLPQQLIAGIYMVLTFGLYAVIGVATRTKALDEYYVAGRSVPAVFNGMATGADWMSAASFISMAGTLWGIGYDGMAYIMGWTGGYVLLALLFAPYIRKFGQYTIPDFVGARFGSNSARVVAAVMAIIVSFTYVTAQVVGVGLVMQRVLGLDYGVGVILGLGGVLFCSFLGGMKAVTWTQVAQYVILIVAYLVPPIFMSIQLMGNPIPQIAYGQALSEINRLENEQNIAKKYIVPFNEPLSNAGAIAAINQANGFFGTKLGTPAPVAIPSATAPELGDWRNTPWDFLALTFCLMAGTAGLPHILIRFYTVPSIKESRRSVFWSLFFIFLLYVTAPSYAALSRLTILKNVVGLGLVKDKAANGREVTSVVGSDGKPLAWVTKMSSIGLMSINDANTDGKLQFSELTINNDLIVLSTPEIAGLPYTISALVAAGGLAAALSTADGLLVVIASSIAHDIYFKTVNPKAKPTTRMNLGKGMIVVAASLTALLALPQLALVAQMVAWAFSLAASTLFPIVLLGIFWKRANFQGAMAGMVGGLIATLWYLVNNYLNPANNIMGLSHLSSGIFGMIANFTLMIIVSLLTAPPPIAIQEMVDQLRNPVGEMSEGGEMIHQH
ncbi:MAG: sodium:solute symporter family protein [Chloroflexota bacterium]|jgi:cation/acetate symporter|nr:cation acetate symporter [Chloroflexota bacterium]